MNGFLIVDANNRWNENSSDKKYEKNEFHKLLMP